MDAAARISPRATKEKMRVNPKMRRGFDAGFRVHPEPYHWYTRLTLTLSYSG